MAIRFRQRVCASRSSRKRLPLFAFFGVVDPPRPLEGLGDIATTWDIPDVLEMLDERLSTADADLLGTIAETLNDGTNRAALETFEVWSTAPAMPLEVAWPRD